MSRWWTPSGPHIGPDEQDFTLLQSVNQPRHDLGAALLALHRVGAAACEAVALEPIPDERSLIEALATARVAFAQPLVGAVSKSVGEGPYAGLLVRDTIDDAEAGALLVFRTAVSKGVPPSLAAQRAGMVYGVPEDELSAYLALASELRAHPAALVAAADQALFTAVEKIASEEIADEEPWEPVQKATPGDRERQRTNELQELFDRASSQDDPATDYYDARDTKGRFARGSVTGPPRVGEPTPRRVERVKRIERVKPRIQRIKRVERVEPTVQATRSASRSKIAQGKDAIRLKQSREPHKKENLDKIAPPANERTNSKLMAALPAEDGPFEQLDQSIALGYSQKEWSALEGGFGRDKDTGTKLFRLGHLTGQKDANIFGYAEDIEQDEHRKVLRNISASLLEDAEKRLPGRADLPIAVYVPDDALVGDPIEAPEIVDGFKFDAVFDYLQERGVDPYAKSELRQRLMRQMRSTRAADNRGDVFWTTAPALEGGSPVIPTVHEIVIEPGVLGRDEGHGKHTDLKFDPNQIMQVTGVEKIYDSTINAMRIRHYVQPYYGDVEKADDPSTPYWDNRVKGRFAPGNLQRLFDEAEAKEKPVVAPKRIERVGRVKRVERVKPRVERQKTVERTASRSKQSRKITRQKQQVIHTQMQRMRHKKAQEIPQDPTGYPELRQDGRYRVMSHNELQLLKKKIKEAGGHEGFIDDPAFKLKLSQDPVPGADADFQLRDQNFRDITATQYGSSFIPLVAKGGPIKLSPLGTEQDHAGAIFDYAERLFKENPDVQQISVDYYGTQAEFFGNSERPDPVVLIEQQDDLKFSKPMKLVPLGTRQYDDFIPDFDEPFEVKEMRAIRGELDFDEEFNPMEDEDWEEDMTSLTAETDTPPLTLNRPLVEHYRLVNVDLTTDGDE